MHVYLCSLCHGLFSPSCLLSCPLSPVEPSWRVTGNESDHKSAMCMCGAWRRLPAMPKCKPFNIFRQGMMCADRPNTLKCDDSDETCFHLYLRGTATTSHDKCGIVVSLDDHSTTSVQSELCPNFLHMRTSPPWLQHRVLKLCHVPSHQLPQLLYTLHDELSLSHRSLSHQCHVHRTTLELLTELKPASTCCSQTQLGIPTLIDSGFEKVVIATCNLSDKLTANTRITDTLDQSPTHDGNVPQELYQRFTQTQLPITSCHSWSPEYHENPRLLIHIIHVVDNTSLLALRSEEYAAGYFGRFFPRKGAHQPLRSWSQSFRIFCSFELSRDRHCHGTRKCPHGLSSDKLSRVAAPSRGGSRGASRVRRNYGDAAAHHSTHNTQDHTHTCQHQQQAHQQEQHTTNPITHQPQQGGGRRRRCAWRPCPGWPDFSSLVFLPTNLRVQLMFSNFPQELWQQCEHTCHIGEVQKRFKTIYFLSKWECGPAGGEEKEPRGEQWSHRLVGVASKITLKIESTQ